MASICSCSCGQVAEPAGGSWYPDTTVVSVSSSSCCPCRPDGVPDLQPVGPCPVGGAGRGWFMLDVRTMVFNGREAIKAVLNGQEVWHMFVPELELSPDFIGLSADGTPVVMQLKSNTTWRIFDF